jgi:proton glutamate symport protein
MASRYISTHYQMILSLVLGVVFGVFFKEGAAYVKPIGDLFIRLLRLIVVPVLMTSIITGITAIGDFAEFKKLGVRTLLYYLFTTCLAVVIGLVVVNLIQPGVGASIPALDTDLPMQFQNFSFLEVVYDLIPQNIVVAMFEENTLGIIFFSLLTGCAMLAVLPKIPEVYKTVKQVHIVILKMTDWVIKISPIGVFSLVYVLVSTLGLAMFKPLALYALTVLSALFIHVFLVLFPLLIVITNQSPFTFVKKISPALITAFSTDSSLATLPVTMDCLETRVKISKRITGFIAPIGATINMDGTALYEAVAALFVAQLYGIELTLLEQFLVFITATLASIGAAGIPSAGLITLLIVLKTVHLPIEGIAILLTIDRILDMFRTTVNVLGDCCGAAIMAVIEEKNVRKKQKCGISSI